MLASSYHQSRFQTTLTLKGHNVQVWTQQKAAAAGDSFEHLIIVRLAKLFMEG